MPSARTIYSTRPIRLFMPRVPGRNRITCYPLPASTERSHERKNWMLLTGKIEAQRSNRPQVSRCNDRPGGKAGGDPPTGLHADRTRSDPGRISGSAPRQGPA